MDRVGPVDVEVREAGLSAAGAVDLLADTQLARQISRRVGVEEIGLPSGVRPSSAHEDTFGDPPHARIGVRSPDTADRTQMGR